MGAFKWEKISKTIQIFCFFRVSPLGRSFNSSRFGLKCIRPSPHLALTLALTLTLTLKPPPTPTLALTLPLTLNKNPLRKSVKQKTSPNSKTLPAW